MEERTAGDEGGLLGLLSATCMSHVTLALSLPGRYEAKTRRSQSRVNVCIVNKTNICIS